MLARTLHAPILTTMSAVAIEDTMADVRKTDAAIIEELNAALKESKRIEEANIKFPEAPKVSRPKDRSKKKGSLVNAILTVIAGFAGFCLSRLLKVVIYMEPGPEKILELERFEGLATLWVYVIALVFLIRTESRAKRGEGRVDNTPKFWTLSPKAKEIMGSTLGGILGIAILVVPMYFGGLNWALDLLIEIWKFIGRVVLAVASGGGDSGQLI